MPYRLPPKPNLVFRLKVRLLDVEPPIWRELLVRGDTPLSKLHELLQTAMAGWQDYHLHQFDVGRERFGPPEAREDEREGEPRVQPEERVTLAEIAPERGHSFLYKYDFGDGWDHEVHVVEVSWPEDGAKYPACIAGARACPPEDCGGAVGYADLLEALRNPKHERHEELMQWVDKDFDPEAFDLAKVNRALQGTRRLKSTRR